MMAMRVGTRPFRALCADARQSLDVSRAARAAVQATGDFDGGVPRIDIVGISVSGCVVPNVPGEQTGTGCQGGV